MNALMNLEHVVVRAWGSAALASVPNINLHNNALRDTSNGWPDINVSNGTCFSAANKTMDSGFIPCGNAFYQGQTCCWQGDTCLDDHACFGVHNNNYVTYLAGCTHSGYLDPACPNKAPFEENAWIGLVYCNGSSHEWTGCAQKNNGTEKDPLASPAACYCPQKTDDRNVMFEDSATLGSTASLPSTSGGSLMWFPPFSPTTPVYLTKGLNITSSSSVPASTAPPTTSATATPDTSASAAPAKKSNTGAIVGGVVGSVGGVAVLGALGFFLFLRRRKRALADKEAAAAAAATAAGGAGAAGDAGVGYPGGGPSPGPGSPGTVMSSPGSPGTMVSGTTATEMAQYHPGTVGSVGAKSFTTSTTPLSELEPNAARPWSLRSELDGSPSPQPGTPGQVAPATGGLTPNMGTTPAMTLDSTVSSPNLGGASPQPQATPFKPVVELPA